MACPQLLHSEIPLLEPLVAGHWITSLPSEQDQSEGDQVAFDQAAMDQTLAWIQSLEANMSAAPLDQPDSPSTVWTPATEAMTETSPGVEQITGFVYRLADEDGASEPCMSLPLPAEARAWGEIMGRECSASSSLARIVLPDKNKVCLWSMGISTCLPKGKPAIHNRRRRMLMKQGVMLGQAEEELPAKTSPARNKRDKNNDAASRCRYARRQEHEHVTFMAKQLADNLDQPHLQQLANKMVSILSARS